jgi:hypothetical protein
VYGGNTGDTSRSGSGVYGYDPTGAGTWGVGAFGLQGDGSELGAWVDGGYGGIEATGPAWAGYFDGDVYITGSCCLASLGAYALHGSDAPLSHGEAVRVIGVAKPSSGSVPILVVTPARAGDPAVGIVDRAMKEEANRVPDAATRHRSATGDRATRTFLRTAGATAAPGGYLWIVTHGVVATSRVDASSGRLKPGDRLSVGPHAGSLVKAYPITMSGVSFFAPGTTVGYALGSLRRGSGEIAVFVAIG